jgi:DNA primase
VSPPVNQLLAMINAVDEIMVMPESDESQDPFLTALGITYATDGYWRGRHIIPIYINGKLMTFEARDFTSQLIPKTLYPKHRPIHSYLWNIDNIIPGQPIIVVEGIKGAIAVLKFGYPNVVSSFGARLTSDQVVLLMTKQPPEITIAYDADDAGDKGTRAALVNILAWTDVYTVQLPEGTDPWDVSIEIWENCLASRKKVDINEKNRDVIRGLSEELFV